MTIFSRDTRYQEYLLASNDIEKGMEIHDRRQGVNPSGRRL